MYDTSMQMGTRILLVDDHPIVREGYRRLLERTFDIVVACEARSGETACELFAAHAPDVVVMDICLPGISGVEATRRMVAHDPAAKILMFSMHDGALFGTRAVQAGARGYITKASAPTVLVEAVRTLAGGGLYLSQDIARSMVVQSMPGHKLPLSALTPREFEVLRLLGDGATSEEIAHALCVNEKTVANYRVSIRQKLEREGTPDLLLHSPLRSLAGP